jgi:hypothetical protein
MSRTKKNRRREPNYTVTCEPETTPIEGNASAIDPETDRKHADWIRRELAAGNDWAWCTVIVTAELDGFEGIASLGCCNYLSRRDFERGPYLDDLKTEAREDLIRNIRKIGVDEDRDSALAYLGAE